MGDEVGRRERVGRGEAVLAVEALAGPEDAVARVVLEVEAVGVGGAGGYVDAVAVAAGVREMLGEGVSVLLARAVALRLALVETVREEEGEGEGEGVRESVRGAERVGAEDSEGAPVGEKCRDMEGVRLARERRDEAEAQMEAVAGALSRGEGVPLRVARPVGVSEGVAPEEGEGRGERVMHELTLALGEAAGLREEEVEMEGRVVFEADWDAWVEGVPGGVMLEEALAQELMEVEAVVEGCRVGPAVLVARVEPLALMVEVADTLGRTLVVAEEAALPEGCRLAVGEPEVLAPGVGVAT